MIMTDRPMAAPEQPRTDRTEKPRQSAAARRFGYAIAIAVNAVLIYLVYVTPGWRVLPFLTEEAASVVALAVLSMVISIGVNLVWLAYDPLWLRSLGELVTAVVALAVLGRILTVFPFTFADDAPWEPLVRIGLIVALVGTSIGVVAHLVTLIRRLVDAPGAAQDNGAGGRP